MNLRLTSWCCANSEREWPARTSRAMRWRCWGLSCSAARAEAGWVSGAAGVVEAETSGTIHMPGTPEGRGQQQPRPMEFRVLSPPPNRGVTAFSCYPAPNHAEVLDGSEPSYPLCLHAETLVVVEPSGDLVQHSGASSHPSGQFYIEGRSAHEDLELHRLLQQSVGQTVQVDLHWPSAENLTTSNNLCCLAIWAKLPACGSLIPSVVY